MSNKWLLFPTQEVVLQDTTWTMATANVANSITSTGLEPTSQMVTFFDSKS